MRLPIFLLVVFLIKVFSLKMFLGKSPIKCLSKNHYKWFFRLSKVFSKFYQTPNFFSKTLFRLKALPIIIVKQTYSLSTSPNPHFSFPIIIRCWRFHCERNLLNEGREEFGIELLMKKALTRKLDFELQGFVALCLGWENGCILWFWL